MTILDELAAYACVRVAESKKRKALETVREEALALPKGGFEFEHALQNEGISFICEI